MDNIVRSNSPSKSEMPHPAEGILGKATSGAHAAVDSVSGVADQAARKAHQAVDKMAVVAQPTAEWLAEQGSSLKATQKKLVANTYSYVSANPLKSIGLAVVAGFILSRMIRLR